MRPARTFAPADGGSRPVTVEDAASSPAAPTTRKPGRRRGFVDRALTPRAPISPRASLIAGVSIWAVVLIVWSVLTYGGVMPDIFLPSPTAVIERAIVMFGDGTIWPNMWSSIEVILLGFIISSVVAVPLGLLMGTFRIVQAALEPLVNFIRYLPVTAFVPLFILWIGLGLSQRVAIIIFGTFFQQLVMIMDVVSQVPEDMLNASYTLGSSRRDVLTHVLLPAARPGIIDTLRITMGWAWTYLVVAELVAADSGLGFMSMQAMRGFQVDKIFLAIGIIGILGLITDSFFRLLRAKFAGWAA
ncbi:MAG: ABC transporter permease [Proteobacteria bacterium]|nr:ABC transporter permease [Pseudomonadota bacterium]